MKFKVTFEDVIEAETEERAYDEMIKYCFDVHNNEDVTAFNFEEVKEEHKTCVPVVPQATEEQRETLHQKAIGKHIETKIEYQLMLRYQSDTELVVDVREDTIDLHDNPMGEEYVEGFFYDGSSLKKNYKDAVADFLELRLKYPDAYEYDEVLEEATDLLAIRYGKGSWQVEARDRFGCRVDR